MTVLANDEWLAGVDGCPAGWIAAFVRPEGDEVRIAVFPRFADVLAEASGIVAVDMPIGLPERTPRKGRFAESAARAVLGQRRSSVFRIPSRPAVYASVAPEPADDRERFRAACKIARETSEDGKAFAIQGFYILDKVSEVDTLLRSEPKLVTRVYETHPEVAFWRLNGGKEVEEPKKKKSQCYGPGLEVRRRLLIGEGLPPAAINASAPKGAGQDDLIDALACAAIARRLHAGIARSFPDPLAQPDAYGLPMAIWA